MVIYTHNQNKVVIYVALTNKNIYIYIYSILLLDLRFQRLGNGDRCHQNGDVLLIQSPVHINTPFLWSQWDVDIGMIPLYSDSLSSANVTCGIIFLRWLMTEATHEPIYIYICMCIYIYVGIYKCIYIYICIYVGVYIYICIYMYIYVCIYIFTYLFITPQLATNQLTTNRR